MVNGEDADDQVPGAIRQRVLDSGQLHVVVDLTGAEDHVGAGVEADHPGVRIGIDQATGRLAGAHAELEHALGREGDRRHGLLLQLVEARHVGVHLLQVALGFPSESVHLVVSRGGSQS